eukprot:TRINITY_DN2228_c0_g1_i1.p1 TRINITY_DN2228_c0_g1~~TRINITY_DN2228_c0_g1_i1.p1  ORF type:complete len:420 (+),score=105.08 TRINITY_DN2228_c0_g1_i1:31-1290(+)
MAIFEACLAFIWIVYIFETYLDIRQFRKLQEERVPKEISSIIDEDKFQKAQSYGRDKTRFGFITGAFSQVESTLILLFGGLPFLWNYSEELVTRFGLGPEYEITVSLVFLLLTMVYEIVVHLPFSIYSTFVIEERHGFNKQTLKLFFVDKVKTLALSIVIGAPVISAIIYIVKWGGPHFYLYAWLFVFVFSMFMITIYPNVIAPLFNKFSPLEDGDLKTKIEKLAASIDFPLTKLYVIDGSKRSGHSNAYFYGFFKNKRIVLYDTLLQQMNHEEVVSVLGHELGHWKMGHTIKMLVISQVHTFLSFFLFGLFVNWDAMYTAFGFHSKPTIIGLMIFFQFIMSPVEHVLGFLMNILSRYHEFQADAFAKKLGFSEQLKSGLIKLNNENLGNLNPDHWYSTYHYTHPPVLERLKALGMKTD